MTRRCTSIWLLFLFFNWAHLSLASHIVGGNIQFTAKGKGGTYKLTLRVFIDEQNSLQGDIKSTLRLTVYRRRDNLKMNDFDLPLVSQTSLKATNQACAQLRPLKLAEVQYSQEIELDLDRYSDPGGYYIVHGLCCRSPIVDNITQPDQSGMVFYLEFPALKSVPNSSPVFSTPTGEYACKDQPYAFSFRAEDLDGDQLRYSIVTPYKGFTNQGTAFSNQPSSSYPTVQWRPGFSAAGAVPGNPALRIDPSTGELTVTAGQVGLFAFSVLCEEFRNGQFIGSVRRDFQLVVIDCPKESPPTPVITLDHVPAQAKISRLPEGTLSAIAVCEGETVRLKTDVSADWLYQWKRDGQDLPGDTTANLTVTKAGLYSVVTQFRAICGRSSPAQSSVLVEVGAARPFQLTASGPTSFCHGKSVDLAAPKGASSYQWFHNNRPLIDMTGAMLHVTESGQYRLVMTETTSACPSVDTLVVHVKPVPNAQVTAPSLHGRCEGDTLRLQAPDQRTYRYQWIRDGSSLSQAEGSTLLVTQRGVYVVTVTDTNQCQTTSEPVDIQLAPAPVVLMLPLPSVCEKTTQRVPLQATPAGGAFSGMGVIGSEFDPQKLAPGRYTITYTLAEAGSCPGRAQQIIIVNPMPSVAVRDITLTKGNSITLNEAGSDTLDYRWSPSDGLSDPTAAHPVVSTTQSTTYQLTATSRQGCQHTTNFKVNVLAILYIPDVFTPNGDGANDRWEIRGMEEYPDCQIEVYNRWGICVFSSKGYEQPWDGRNNGQELSPASYYYRTRTGDSSVDRSGSVVLVR